MHACMYVHVYVCMYVCMNPIAKVHRDDDDDDDNHVNANLTESEHDLKEPLAEKEAV